VAVIGGNEMTQRIVVRELDPQYAISTAATPEEAVALGTSFACIVAAGDASDVPRIRERFPPQPVVHFVPVLSDDVIDHAATDPGVHHATTSTELREILYVLARPNRTTNRRHPLQGFEVTMAAAAGAAFSLHDLSNEGFSAVVSSDADVDALLPGATLERVAVRTSEGAVVVEAATARVAHIAVIPEGYRLGCVFVHAETRKPRARAHRIKGKARCAAVLRAPLAAGQVSFQSIDGSLKVRDCSGDVSVVAGKLAVSGGSHPFVQGAPVTGHFDSEGAHYTFVTSVLQESPFELALPNVVDEERKRDIPRLRLGGRDQRLAVLTSPFAALPFTRSILDISATGIGVALDPARDLLPVGTVLGDVFIDLDRHNVKCRGRVCSLASEAGGILRCGIELDGLTDKDRALLGDFVMRSRFVGAEDGHGIAFDDVWALLRETGLVSDGRAQELEASRAEIERTHSRLHGARSQQFHSVIIKDEEGLKGYVAGARVYRRTWFFQHLAALPSLLGSYLLAIGPMEHLAQAADAEYFKLCYLAKNPFPARIFGGFAKRHATSDLSDLRPFHFATMWANQPWIPPASSLRVTEASAVDLETIERYFVARERPIMIRSDDLSRSGLTLDQVATSYRRIGLQRQRRVLVAFDDDTPVGFALAELSSVGLNLQEHFTSLRTYVLDEGRAQEAQVRGALIDAARDVYRRAGRSLFRVFFDAEDEAMYARLGIASQAVVMAWTCHRSLFQKFCAHLERQLRDRVLAAAAKKKASQVRKTLSAAAAQSDKQRP
jgi:hypothetical protein